LATALASAASLLVAIAARAQQPPPAPGFATPTAPPIATPLATGPPGGASPAPATASLSIVEAIARALANAPPVAAARAAEAAARAQLAEATADLAPILGLMGSAFRHQKPALVTPIHGFTPGLLPSFDRTVLQGTLQLRYDLWDGGLRSGRIAERKARLEAAEAATAAAEGAAGSRAVAAYLALLTLDEQLAAHGERDAALAAERNRVEQLLAVGRAAPVDVLRVEAAQAAAAADRVGLAAARDRSGRDLQRLLGEDPRSGPLPPLAPATLGVAEPPPRDDLLARALAGSGEVERARRELRAAEAAVGAARAARAPALRAEGNVLAFAGGNGDEAAEWNAGLRVALPLWDRHVAARVALAEAGRSAAAAGVRLAEDAVGGALDAAWADLAAARARAGSLAEAEAKNAEVVRIERLRLGAGAGVEADYLRAEADLLASRAAAVEARHRVAAARAELARVTGELSAAWVESAFAPAARAGEGGDR
jgi:outer membrane protein